MRHPTPAQASRLPARANWPEGASVARCWRVGGAAHATCRLGCSGSKCTCDGMPVWSFRSRRACKRRASAAAASSLRRRIRCDAGEWRCVTATRRVWGDGFFGGWADARPLRCAETRKCGRAGASRARPSRNPVILVAMNSADFLPCKAADAPPGGTGRAAALRTLSGTPPSPTARSGTLVCVCVRVRARVCVCVRVWFRVCVIDALAS